MKYGICPKCKTKSWLEEHHVYPRSKFKDDKKAQENTMLLCPNCHTDLHQKMGKINPENKRFYDSFHLSWLTGIIILAVIFSLITIII